MPSIFEQVRERVTMLDAITFLGLQVKQESPGQYRARCPACKGSEKRDLSINAEKGFRCFRGDKKGNDATALVAHVRGISQTDAANELAEHFISAARASHSPAPKAAAPTESRRARHARHVSARCGRARRQSSRGPCRLLPSVSLRGHGRRSLARHDRGLAARDVGSDHGSDARGFIARRLAKTLARREVTC